MSYIETSNLDGETNLKIKQSLIVTADMVSSERTETFSGEIECEQASRHVNEFSGNLITEHDTHHYGIDQLLLRGARLKKHSVDLWHCRLYRARHEDSYEFEISTFKDATVDVMTNRRILVLFFVLVTLAVVSAVGLQLWRNANSEKTWYLSFLGF